MSAVSADFLSELDRAVERGWANAAHLAEIRDLARGPGSQAQAEPLERLREALRQRKAAPTTGEFEFWTGEVFKAAVEVAEAETQPQAEPGGDFEGKVYAAYERFNKAAYAWRSSDRDEPLNLYAMREALRPLLAAAPQPQAVLAAEVAERGFVRWLNGENILPVGTKLYAAPQPQAGEAEALKERLEQANSQVRQLRARVEQLRAALKPLSEGALGKGDEFRCHVYNAINTLQETADDPQPQAARPEHGFPDPVLPGYEAPKPKAELPVESFPMPLQDWVASLPIPGVVKLDTSDHGDGLWRLRNHSPRFLFVLERGDRITIVAPKGGAYLFEGAQIFATTGPIQPDGLLALCSRRFK